jgi:ADP-ribose pyrophosphatase YjhB (NUDIX family)
VLDGSRERPGCAACGHVVYRNPVPVAMVLARQADRLLLVKRGNEPLNGFWAPPAGYVEIDESVEAAAIRETEEETGLKVALEGPPGVHSTAGIGIVLVVHHARVEGGTLAPGPEVLDAGFFPATAMPPQPALSGGSQLDHWLLSLLPGLMGSNGANGEGEGRRIRELEARLRSVLQEVDAGRDEMSPGDIDPDLLREAGSLRRQIDELRRPADR